MPQSESPSLLPSPPSTFPILSPLPIPWQSPPGTQRSSRAGGSHVARCGWAIAPARTLPATAPAQLVLRSQSPPQEDSQGCRLPLPLFFKPCCFLVRLLFGSVPGAAEKMGVAEEQAYWWCLRPPGPGSVGTSGEETLPSPQLTSPSLPPPDHRLKFPSSPAPWFPCGRGESPGEEQGPRVCPIA